MDVFVSFTGADREVKNQVVAALRQRIEPGDSVWESDEGCTSDYSADSIGAIRKSRVFVVLLSAHSMSTASYVFNEVVEARQREMRGEMNLIVFRLDDEPLTPRFVMQLNHITDANHLTRLYHNTETGLQSLADKVRALLELWKKGEPEMPADFLMPISSGVTLGGPGYFVANSREDVFREIDRRFEQSNVVFAVQFGGYGRQTAVRKYVELHAGDYDKNQVLTFSNFSGTVYDFFLTGLTFDDGNDGRFSNLADRQVIQRKVEQLNKRNARTLLVVPNVDPAPREEQFMADVLSGLKCRVIFIAESMTPFLQERFPPVYVDRMDDDSLLTLFFHYYRIARPDETEALREPLLAFFKSVDGHTKTVELAATVLDYQRIYPPELPETLDRLSLETGDEISSRIFQSVSDLFELKNFGEPARRILMCGAMMADRPMDERDFVELLRSCGAFDPEQMDMLTSLRWIDARPDTRKIFMDPLICRVCKAKIAIDDALLDACLMKLNDDLLEGLVYNRQEQSRTALRRFLRFWEMRKMDASAQAVRLLLTTFDYSSQARVYKDLPALRAQVLKECAALPEKSRRECQKNLWDIAFSIMHAKSEMNQRSFVDADSDLFRAIYAPTTGKALNELADSIADPELSESVKALAQAPTVGAMISLYLSIVRFISRDAGRAEAEDYDNVGFYLETIGAVLDPLLLNSPFLRLKLCRARIEVTDILEGYYSEANLFRLWCNTAYCLMDLGEYTEELDDAFDNTLALFNKVWSQLYSSREEALQEKCDLISHYLNAMVKAKRPEKAQAAYLLLCALPLDNVAVFCSAVDAADSVTNAYMEQGDTEGVKAFLPGAVMPLKGAARSLPDADAVREAKDTLSLLDGMSRVLMDPQDASAFGDGSRKYVSYYETYPADPADKRKMNRYSDIARKAQRLDYSSASREELLSRLDGLSRRARKGAHWEDLAPEAFAVVSEAGFRTLGYRYHLVQFIGACAILDGSIAEIQNGEGKTYTIALAAVMHTLYGRKAFVVDSSEYLCRRNFIWMRGLMDYLGRETGLLADRTSAFRRSYAGCDVIYATVRFACVAVMTRELGDLTEDPLQLDAAIVDEADDTMIAAVCDPFPLVGNVEEDYRPLYELVYRILSRLPGESSDYFLLQGRSIILRPALYELAEQEMEKDMDEMTAEQQSGLEKALRIGVAALFQYRKNADYFIRENAGGPPAVVAESASDGSFYTMADEFAFFIWLREGRPDLARAVELARRKLISTLDAPCFFRSFAHLGGASATVSSLKKEFWQIYRLSIFPVPPNVPPEKRVDKAPSVFLGTQAKEQAIVSLVKEKHASGQPVLVITGSVTESQHIAELLFAAGLGPVLINASNAEENPDQLSYAGEKGRITVTTALANRGVDICLGGSPSVLAKNALLQAGVDPAELDRAISGMDGVDGSAALRQRYTELCALNWQRISRDKSELEALGGLCVIGTTCFDDLRVEQQMRGRCGRQGSPGESYVFYSCEDESLRRLTKDLSERLLRFFGGQDVDLQSKLLNRTIANARLRLQNSRYSGLAETPGILYYQDARKLILGRIPAWNARDFDFRAFLVGLFDEDPRYRMDLRAVLSGKPENPGDPSLIRLLADQIKGRQVPSQRHKIPGFLADAYLADLHPDIQGSRASRVLTNAARSAWEKYLERMRVEITKAARLLPYDFLRRQRLTNLSKSLSQQLRLDELEKALLQYLRWNRAMANILPVRTTPQPADPDDSEPKG